MPKILCILVIFLKLDREFTLKIYTKKAVGKHWNFSTKHSTCSWKLQGFNRINVTSEFYVITFAWGFCKLKITSRHV